MNKGISLRAYLYGTVREKLSPAESSFEGNHCEVHPGVDLANVNQIISWVRITHVTCIEWRTLILSVSIRVEPRSMTSSLEMYHETELFYF